MDETTSPTSTAPSPTKATEPIAVDDSQELDASGCFRRALRDLLVGVVRAGGGRRNERDEEDNTNPIDFRLVVSYRCWRSETGLPLKIEAIEGSFNIGLLA